jgi:maleamate amidohydrolase
VSNAPIERVWERFLTEQDKRDLARRAPRMREHPGTQPALVLIDLYRWVFGDEPLPLDAATATWPGSCGLPAWEALPHLRRLLAAARAAGIPVVHTTEDPRSPIASWVATRRQGSVPDERWYSRFEIVDDVRPIDGELVLVKEAPSAFWGTPLSFHLSAAHVDTVIVAGESTSGCVRATVVDARTHRFDVIVPAECVFDRHELAHAASLFDMHNKYADVLPVDDVIALVASS